MTTYIVWAPIPSAAVSTALGLPEYSYGFVLARFLPLLAAMGTVREVTDPTTQVDPIFRACRDRDEPCVFLAFAPPHRAPTGLACPTTTVFAWEFDTIPDEGWGGEPGNDWRVTLRAHGRAIVLSRHSALAVTRSLGPNFPVRPIPAPIFARYASASPRAHPPIGNRFLTFTGTLIDSRELGYADAGLTMDPLAARLVTSEWDGSAVEFDVAEGRPGAARLVGFYHPEPWGAWSRVAAPSVMLPVSVAGPVEIVITAHGLGRNVDRTITVNLGDSNTTIRLPRRRRDIRIRLSPTASASALSFAGIAADIPAGRDERTMGMALVRVRVQRPSAIPPRGRRLIAGLRDITTEADVPQTSNRLDITGVLYTSVLNPVDHRKNWQQLITAFCWAFREDADATLLLKMTHHAMSSFAADVQDILHRVGPVRCRVVVMHGFLSDDEYRELTEATTYYANASSAEGLCMPLMEFLSAGVPAIATDNTAMADYVTPGSCFVVRSSPGYTHWPHDQRRMIRTVEHRVDWESLVSAFRQSHDVALTAPARYAALSRAARADMAVLTGDETVAAALDEFLRDVRR